MVLGWTQSSAAVRVCDKCYSEVKNEIGESKIPPASSSSASAHNTPVDPRMQMIQVPNWTYAFKPFSEQGKLVNIGRLFIKVIEAENLPAADFLGTTDAYVTLSLGEETRKTKIVTSLNPEWKEEFVVDVSQATGVVRLRLMDSEKLPTASDRLLAELAVPLAELPAHERSVQWFDLPLSEAWLATEQGQKHLAKRHEHVDKVGFDLKPRILLEFHYTFSKVGEFFSHFHQEPEAPPAADDFNIQTLFSHAMRLLTLLGPVFAFFASVGDVMAWRKPYVSLAVLAIYVYVALHPWTLLVLLQLLLLKHMVFQYVYRVWERSAEAEAERTERLEDEERRKEKGDKKGVIHSMKHAGHSALQSTKSLLSPLLMGMGSKPLDEKEQAHLNGVIRGIANTSLRAAGYSDNLALYQNMIKRTADLVQFVVEMFQWKNEALSKTVFLSLLATTIYCCFYSHRYLYLIVGVYVLTLHTVPLQLAQWLCLSVVKYFRRNAKASS